MLFLTLTTRYSVETYTLIPASTRTRNPIKKQTTNYSVERRQYLCPSHKYPLGYRLIRDRARRHAPRSRNIWQNIGEADDNAGQQTLDQAWVNNSPLDDTKASEGLFGIWRCHNSEWMDNLLRSWRNPTRKCRIRHRATSAWLTPKRQYHAACYASHRQSVLHHFNAFC